VPRETLQRDIASAVASHQRLLASVDDLTDAEAWSPSLLPDWTVGHVLTHLARNADSHVRMLKGAEEGLVVDQYEGGAASRAADIEAGADRSAEAIVSDLRISIWKLEQTWDNTTEKGWSGCGRTFSGEWPSVIMPYRRRTEVEIHHVDLDLGYTIDDWPAEFVKSELARLKGEWASRQPMGLTELPAAVLALAPNERLAWLTGRSQIEGIAPAGIYV
jgi:maleylpyruvate isomerase